MMQPYGRVQQLYTQSLCILLCKEKTEKGQVHRFKEKPEKTMQAWILSQLGSFWQQEPSHSRNQRSKVFEDWM